jgi:hypothetical protein
MADSKGNSLVIKIVVVALWLALIIPGGRQLAAHRNYEEAVVLGPGVTEVKKLSDWAPYVANTPNDCSIYVLDSGVPGGSMLVIGGTHPEEPAGVLSAVTIVENVVPTTGKIYVAVRANRSASTVTRPGDAYPQFFNINTDFGKRTFRMGDRWSNPLDSWPDPEVYVHYPSKQLLAYMDVRNLNRTWPGRPDGMITERTTRAFIDMIKAENIDIFVDNHEAELEYSVISTIVAHQAAADVAAMASMMLSAGEFNMGMEFSPTLLHGLSHREVGDHTDAYAFEIEVPEPFLDRVRGITDEALLLEGKDEFVMRAGQAGLLYEKIDENGWNIHERVGRTNSTIDMIVQMFAMFYPDKPITYESLPMRNDIVANGLGHYLLDPAQAEADRVVYE